MDHAMLTYRVKPEQLERHLELLAAVYAELNAAQPANFRYATWRLDDGASFVELVAGDSLPGPLPQLEAFRRYRAELDERCDERRFADLDPFGNYPPGAGVTRRSTGIGRCSVP